MVNVREKEIKEILCDFRKRTNIHYSNLFTDDGFIISTDYSHELGKEDFHQSIGAIFATIMAMAENGVELFKEGCKIKSISIQAGDQLDNEGFTIILDSITEDINLSIVFITFLNLGLILFELNQTIHKLKTYFSKIHPIKNLEGIGTLN
ncbi:MAG: hypothetical protein P8Y70_06785 [Candidatus Lokiarchaeota archaeon]